MQPSADPFHPQVTGFDLPPPDARGGEQMLVVLLDGAPARSWMVVFAPQAEAFRDGHGLSGLRVVGSTLSVAGRMGDVRALAAHVKALVHRVSRLCLQQRLTALAADDEDEAAAGTSLRPPADPAVLRDLAAIAAMPGVDVMLEAVTRATGMRFAAVARVTDDRWTACAVYDLIDFGLRPGQDLVLETTICNEIRQHRHTVHFDRASTHPVFAGHPTPAMYGFESYISVPILLPDGTFFGTLCALDPEPSLLDEATVHALEMFAEAIGRRLGAGAA